MSAIMMMFKFVLEFFRGETQRVDGREQVQLSFHELGVHRSELLKDGLASRGLVRAQTLPRSSHSDDADLDRQLIQRSGVELATTVWGQSSGRRQNPVPQK